MERRIGFGRRLGAFLIDFVFIMGGAFILSSLTGEFLERFVDFSKITEEQLTQMESIYGNFSTIMLTIGVSATLISFLYNLVEGFLGFTAGKLLLGIKIGTQEGKQAETGTLMTRFAIKNISAIVGLLGLATLISVISTIGSVAGFIIIIGCFFALGEKKLALHDMIAKTAVYKKAELADGTAAQPLFENNQE